MLQEKVSMAVVTALADSLEPLAHCHDAVSLSLFYRYSSLRYADRRHDFVISIASLCEEHYANSFSPCTTKLWNSLPAYCFPLTCNPNSFKTTVNGFLELSFFSLFFFPFNNLILSTDSVE